MFVQKASAAWVGPVSVHQFFDMGHCRVSALLFYSYVLGNFSFWGCGWQRNNTHDGGNTNLPELDRKEHNSRGAKRQHEALQAFDRSSFYNSWFPPVAQNSETEIMHSQPPLSASAHFANSLIRRYTATTGPHHAIFNWKHRHLNWQPMLFDSMANHEGTNCVQSVLPGIELARTTWNILPVGAWKEGGGVVR